MNAITRRKLTDLRLAMERDPRQQALRSAEEELKKDPKALKLVEKKDAALAKYMQLRTELGAEDVATIASQEELHQAKLALDLLPASKAYSDAFSALNLLYREVDEILFGLFREIPHCGGRHD